MSSTAGLIRASSDPFLHSPVRTDTPAAPAYTQPNKLPEGFQPVEIAIPGMHALSMAHVVKHLPPTRPDGTKAHALDLGAGHGALCIKLRDMGYAVNACDMFPELFAVPGIECRKVDAHGTLPYPDASFDLVCMFEVVEHLESHRAAFAEIARILRPGGVFAFTTPNIMSLKSRLSFLMTGHFYSHGPLDPAVNDPVRQHIAAFTPDRYRFILAHAGLNLEAIECDKAGGTSIAMMWLYPFIRFASRKHKGAQGTRFNNCTPALLGRTMVGIARKPR